MDKFQKFFFFGLVAVIFALATFGYIKYRSYESQLVRLRDEVASRDTTITTKDGSFTKLAREFEDLKVSNSDLQKTIDKQKQDVISAQQISATWKKMYDEAVIPVHVSPITPTTLTLPVTTPTDWHQIVVAQCTEKQEEYVAKKDFGLVIAGCRILTFDPKLQTRVILEQGSRPIKLNLALTRDGNKQWHSYVKVEPPDDQNISIDILTTAVNTEPLNSRWYEKIAFQIDAGVGVANVLGGLGISYDIGQFSVGPKVWGVLPGVSTPLYGINVTWRPFKVP